MSRVKLMAAILIACVVGAVWTDSAFCQAAGGGGGGRGGFDPAAMRQRRLDNIKQSLGVTDQEWTALQPRVEKVMTLSMQARMGGMMGRMGGRGGAAAEAPAPTTETEKTALALRTVLENKDSTKEQVAQALTAYRNAREKAEQDLAKAQEELKALLTPRQEAQLVLDGLLK